MTVTRQKAKVVTTIDGETSCCWQGVLMWGSCNDSWLEVMILACGAVCGGLFTTTRSSSNNNNNSNTVVMSCTCGVEQWEDALPCSRGCELGAPFAGGT